MSGTGSAPVLTEASSPVGRVPRSRLDRPCDACRRHKHMCTIPVKNQPCDSCKARKKDCTFAMPPTTRKRKKRSPDPPTVNIASDFVPNTIMDLIQQPHDSSDAPTFVNDHQAGNGRPSTDIHNDAGSGPSSLLAPAGTLEDWLDTANQWASPIVSSHNSAAALEKAPTRTQHVQSSTQHNLPSLMTAHGSATVGDAVSGSSLQGPLEPNNSPELDMSDAPLDFEGGDEEESHFIGSGAFSGLALRGFAGSQDAGKPNTLSFRQVSSDTRMPAFFVRHQSYMYGRAPSTGKSSFEAVLAACVSTGVDVLSQSLSALQRITLPTLPFIDSKRLEMACLGVRESGPVPYALLAGIIAHTTPYLHAIRPLHKTLWYHALLGLEDDYRQPRLQTIQLALLVLSSRPSENIGQSDIGLGRAISTAHLLGLHIDPTSWSLPEWERTIRKRIWWTLLIHDKWRALLYGRPSNLHKNNYNVPLPEMDDRRNNSSVTPSAHLSFYCFVGTCRLTLLVDELLGSFYTVEAILNTEASFKKLGVLEEIHAALKEFEKSLPEAVQWSRPRSLNTALPTGVRSLQLSYYGLAIIVHRLLLETLSKTLPLQALAVMHSALSACESVVDMLEALTASDRELFWMPYSSNHVSNCASLLLILATHSLSLDHSLVRRATEQIIRLSSSLISIYNTSQWDVAYTALRRLSTLLVTAGHNVPEMQQTYQAVNETLGIPLASEMMSADELLISLGLTGTDPMAWMGNDLSWMGNDLSWMAAGIGEGLGGITAGGETISGVGEPRGSTSIGNR